MAMAMRGLIFYSERERRERISVMITILQNQVHDRSHVTLLCLLICFFPSMILVPRSKTVLLLVDYRNYPFLINDLSFATVKSASI